MRQVWNYLFGLERWPTLQDILTPWRVFAYICIYGWGLVVGVAMIMVLLDLVFGWGLFDSLTGHQEGFE